MQAPFHHHHGAMLAFGGPALTLVFNAKLVMLTGG
jgi:hypothetical protein